MESIGFDKSESNHLPMSFFPLFSRSFIPIVHFQPLSFADMRFTHITLPWAAPKNKNDEQKM